MENYKNYIIVVIVVIAVITVIAVNYKPVLENFEQTDADNLMRNVIDKLINNLPKLLDPRNLDPTGTISTISNIVPGAGSIIDVSTKTLGVGIKVTGDVISIGTNTLNGLEKTFKGDPIGGILQIGNGITNGVVNVSKTALNGIKDVANIAGDGIVKFGNDLVQLGQKIGCALNINCPKKGGTPNGELRSWRNGYGYGLDGGGGSDGNYAYYMESDWNNEWRAWNYLDHLIQNKMSKKCLNPGGSMVECDKNNTTLRWSFYNGMIINEGLGMCLSGDGSPPSVKNCNPDDPFQNSWKVGRYRSWGLNNNDYKHPSNNDGALNY